MSQKQLLMYIGGRGKMAQAMVDYCVAHSILHVRHGDRSVQILPADAYIVAINFGLIATLTEILAWNDVESRRLPLIQGSTKQALPEGIRCPFVLAPNLAISALRFIEHTRTLRRDYPNALLTIEETHQASKIDAEGKPIVSGTALEIAKSLGIPTDTISSIRDVPTQLACGVPPEHLGGHAYHWVRIHNTDDIVITHEIRVHGRESYAAGAVALARAIMERDTPLEPRIYQPLEVLKLLDRAI